MVASRLRLPLGLPSSRFTKLGFPYHPLTPFSTDHQGQRVDAPMTEQDEDESQIWVLEPSWQNFSSMYREAVCARDASSGMEISHHRMAALYFGIATIECFLNREMTRHQLHLGKEHGEIRKLLLGNRDFMKKVKAWPKEITGRDLSLRPNTLESIKAINGLRGNLTHLKNYWPDTFDELGRTDPMAVVELVAEYIIAFHHAKGELFPYWVWGWNYLCPNREGYQISLLPYTQFFHSLSSLGYKPQLHPFRLSTDHGQEFLSSFDGYQKVAKFLRSCDQCEPKWDVAPHQPKLCRRWWEPAHQKSCGAATPEAIARALELDEMRARRFKAKGAGAEVNLSADTPTWLQRAANRLKRWVPF